MGKAWAHWGGSKALWLFGDHVLHALWQWMDVHLFLASSRPETSEGGSNDTEVIKLHPEISPVIFTVELVILCVV